MIRKVVALKLECGHEVPTPYFDPVVGWGDEAACKECDEVVAKMKRFYARRDPWQNARTIGTTFACLRLLEKEGLVESGAPDRGGNQHWRYKEQDDADA